MRKYALLIVSGIVLITTTVLLIVTRNALLTTAGALIAILLTGIWIRAYGAGQSDRRFTSRHGSSQARATAGPNSTGRLHLVGTTDSALKAARRAINELDRFSLESESENGLTVRVQAGWNTWGEIMHVTLHEDASGVDVQVRTEQVQSTTRIDFGQARRDVERLLTAVEHFARQRDNRPR